MFSVLLTSLLQLSAISFWIAQLALVPWIICIIFFYLVFYTKIYYVVILLFTWLLIDWKTPCRGGRRWDWIRNLSAWNYAASYFPVKLIKTVDLDVNKNYLCGYHPHGIICAGSTLCFATEAAGFRKIFPNMKPYVLSHGGLYLFPVLRDFTMSFGICSVAEESISWILNKEGKGNMTIVVVGGVAEMFDSHPKTARLTLRTRNGFVKQAIKAGASLIPIFGFGENDLFTQMSNPRGSLLRRTQEFLRGIFIYPLILIRGRIFPPFFWTLLPEREPVIVVVGKPMDVILNPNPSEDEVNRYHGLYIKNLRALFNDYRKNYPGYENVELEIF